MSKSKGGVSVTTTVDIGDLERRLVDAERRVFVRWEKKILTRIKREWRGWQYMGRKDGAPVNVSLSTWTSKVQTTDGAALIIENNIGYAGHVHRAGSDTLVVDTLFAAIVAEDVPKLTADLAAEIAKNLGTPKKRRKVGPSGSPATEETRIEA